MDQFSINPRAIAPEEALKTGCFTTLPIRMNPREDVANTATYKVLKDWHRYIGDGHGKASHSSLCELGNWCALTHPESLPERLGIITYLSDLGMIHDGKPKSNSLRQLIRTKFYR
jgi:hypothetical protein